MIESLKIKNLMKYDPDSITTEFCEFFSTVGERFAKDIKPPKTILTTTSIKCKNQLVHFS